MGFQSVIRSGSGAYLAEDHQMPERLFQVIARGRYTGQSENEEGAGTFMPDLNCTPGPIRLLNPKSPGISSNNLARHGQESQTCFLHPLNKAWFTKVGCSECIEPASEVFLLAFASRHVAQIHKKFHRTVIALR